MVGFGLTWVADQVIGLRTVYRYSYIPFRHNLYSFILMIQAVFSLLGIRSTPIFVLMLFFGGPLLSIAPEMMSSFYGDWIYSWLPMRFMVQGLRVLFFFGEGLPWNSSLITLVWIAAASIVVILASALRIK
ncbi:hypothetical protein CHH49_05585 [Terribacillus saccharophilus]|nr:hypothetical protein CHH49_05585 [Terribacillus saccharophilus]